MTETERPLDHLHQTLLEDVDDFEEGLGCASDETLRLLRGKLTQLRQLEQDPRLRWIYDYALGLVKVEMEDRDLNCL